MGQVTKESADTLSLADDIYIEETGLVMFHYLVIQSDLLEMVKWPFVKVKWPPTRESKGHFESPGILCL